MLIHIIGTDEADDESIDGHKVVIVVKQLVVC